MWCWLNPIKGCGESRRPAAAPASRSLMRHTHTRACTHVCNSKQLSVRHALHFCTQAHTHSFLMHDFYATHCKKINSHNHFLSFHYKNFLKNRCIYFRISYNKLNLFLENTCSFKCIFSPIYDICAMQCNANADANANANAMSRCSLKTNLHILRNCASQVMSFLCLSTLISGFSLSSCHVSSHSRKTTALFRVFSKPAWRLSPLTNTPLVCVFLHIKI